MRSLFHKKNIHQMYLYIFIAVYNFHIAISSFVILYRNIITIIFMQEIIEIEIDMFRCETKSVMITVWIEYRQGNHISNLLQLGLLQPSLLFVINIITIHSFDLKGRKIVCITTGIHTIIVFDNFYDILLSP